MTFACPLAFLLFVPLAFAAWRMLRRPRRQGVLYSAVCRISPRKTGWRTCLASLSPWIAVAAMALLVIACARPRVSLGKNRKNVDAIAISMVVDISGSMSALDLTPEGTEYSKDTTRLAVVKKVFADFVSKRPDDLIGLVTFGTFANVRAPLTSDHETLLGVLRGVEIPMGDSEAETAIGDGLSVAILRLKDAKPKSKVVILLSDGVSNIGSEDGGVDPEVASEAAAKLGIKVYTIGVGTKARLSPYLMVDMYGRSFVRRHPSGFDEAQLRGIAEKTQGMYFPVNDEDALAKALEEIDKLETTPIEASEWNRWIEYFPALLSAGVVLLLLSVASSMVSLRRIM